MQEGVPSVLRGAVDGLARVGDVVGHEVRSAILLRLLCGPARWGELRRFLGSLYGYPVNPNVLAFHLRRLVEHGIIERRDADGDPVYVLSSRDVAEFITGLLRRRGVNLEEICGEGGVRLGS